MKRRKQQSRNPAPDTPGWYRITSVSIEELRYFDGSVWTHMRRDVPYWVEGPEWSDVIRPGAYIDSDDPSRVKRNLSSPTFLTVRKKSALRRRRRPTQRLAWFLVAIMVLVTVSSYIVTISRASSSAATAFPAVPLITNRALARDINSNCIAAKLADLAPLSSIASASSTPNNPDKVSAARAYQTTLARLDLSMRTLSAPLGDKGSYASWQILVESASSQAAVLSQRVDAARGGVASAAKALTATVGQMNRFSAANSIDSCQIMIA